MPVASLSRFIIISVLHCGIYLRKMGTETRRGVGAGANPGMVWEWDEIARDLARGGRRVFIPNMHSDPQTKPGGKSRVFDVLDLLVKQLHNETGRPDTKEQYTKKAQDSTADVTIMGKSWGGDQALRYTAHRPGIVDKLVLVAPVGKGDAPSEWRGRGPATIPALLLFAKDDMTFSGARDVKQRKLAGLLPNLQVHSIEKGGHRIRPEFSPFIISFLGSSKRTL